MTLESRLTAFAQAVGGDIKELQEEDETVIVKAKVTGNLAIGSAYSSTPISFGTEIKDDENFWNGTRFQPTKAGWYRIHATSYCGGIPVGGYWTTYLVKNWPTGTPYNGTGTIESLSGGNSVVAGGYVFGENDAIVYFNGTTDYIELFYWTSHSGYTLYGAYSFFEVFSADHKGPKGDKGDKGDPGDSVQVPLDVWHLVGGGR